MPEPRMPLILDEKQSRHWLEDMGEKELEETIDEFARMNIDIKLNAHTVRPIKGKDVIPNNENAAEEYIYPELEDVKFE